MALLVVSTALAAIAAQVAADEPLSQPQTQAQSDADVEAFLRRAKVVEAKEIGSGITRPLRLVLEHEGQRRMAAWKTVEVVKRGPRVEPGYPTEHEFTDDYHYERAAYVLDRELGLDMVPVTVLRSYRGQRGAAIDWIARAINEVERREQELKPADALILSRQRATMRVFDALILNTDRTLTNQLITPSDWQLHLIDHSRSFRLSPHLPDHFLERPARLSRELLARLEALEAKRLRQLLRGAVSSSRIKSLLDRRDKILEKVEDDRRKFGDPFVFGAGANDLAAE